MEQVYSCRSVFAQVSKLFIYLLFIVVTNIVFLAWSSSF